jgi:hypothetical protein
VGTSKAGSRLTYFLTVPSLASLSAECPGTQNTPQYDRWKCHSTPFCTVVLTETLFWQPEDLSEPPDCQNEYLLNRPRRNHHKSIPARCSCSQKSHPSQNHHRRSPEIHRLERRAYKNMINDSSLLVRHVRF